MGWGLIVVLGAVVVLGATTILMGALYGALLQDPVSLVGTLAGVFAAICLGFVAEVAAGVLFLVGFYQTHAGRHEYGLEQSHSVERAVIFLIIYIVLSAVSLVYSSTLSLVLGIAGPSTVPDAVASLVLSPIIALFAGLTLEHSLRSVASPPVRSRLRTALLLGVIGAAVGPGLTLLATGGGPLTVNTVSAGIVAGAVAGQGMCALSILLFWLAFQETRRSLEAGSPAPVLPRVEQVYPWLYRPWIAFPPSQPGPPPQEPPKT